MARDGPRGEARGTAFAQFYRWVVGIGYERNVGGLERAIRYAAGALAVLAGAAVAAVPILGDGRANAVVAVGLVAAGAYLIYEARVQYCPLNHTLDRNTYDER